MRHNHLHVLLLTTALVLGGCAARRSATRPAPPATPKEAASRLDARVLQQDLMAYSDRYMTALADVCDAEAARAPTEEIRTRFRVRKATGSGAALAHAVNPNAVAGLMDMVVTATLARQSLEDPSIAATFGAGAERLLRVLRYQENNGWTIAARYFAPSQLEELRAAIARWREAHPDQRYVVLVRLSEFPEARQHAQQVASSGTSSVFSLLFLDPLAGLDPAVREMERSRETAERMFYYMQRLPTLLGWQLELVYGRMLKAPEVTQALESATTLATSTTQFADSAGRMAQTAEAFRQDMPRQREAAIEQMQGVIDQQRDRAIKELAATVAQERHAMLDEATRHFSEQSTAAIAHATASAEASLNRSVDLAFWRAALLLVLAAGLLALLLSHRRHARAREHEEGLSSR